MNVRQATQQDAVKIIEVMKDAEASGFMLYNPNERQLTSESLEKLISHINAAAKSSFFVAEENEEILGYLIVKGEHLSRTSHRAAIAIGVHSLSRGKGTGTKLFEYVINWAKQQQLHRLELTVIEHNHQAIHLYKKMGFKEEGIKRDSLWIDGQFVNEIYMSLLL